MNKYIAAYTDFNDSNLYQTMVTAYSQAQACIIVLEEQGFNVSEWATLHYDELKEEAFNSDAQISAFEIS